MLQSSDIWSVVFQQVHCSKALLSLRLVSKSFRDLIPIEMVTGIPEETARLLRSPKSSRYGRIPLHGNDEMEGALANEGRDFWVWIYSDPVRLIRYTVEDRGSDELISRYTTTFTNTNSESSFLWLKITNNGLICMLTTSSRNPNSNPAVLSIMRSNLDDDEKNPEVIMVTSVKLRCILRDSVFFDESPAYIFVKNSMHCFSWGGRSFIIMLPIDQRENVSFVEIKKMSVNSVRWVSWTLDCRPCKRIGCICQTKNMLYIIPETAGCVYTMNLEDENPRPKLQQIIPHLPSIVSYTGINAAMQQTTIASKMEVSENGKNFIIYSQCTRQIFHLTSSSVRQLDYRFEVSGFTLLGNDAVVCFFKESVEYRLYNLQTKDLVRNFYFPKTPLVSFMGKDCIWSIGPTMSVSRLT
jgi:hypothetical protein